jgi:flagellar basal body-associated protein FliL
MRREDIERLEKQAERARNIKALILVAFAVLLLCAAFAIVFWMFRTGFKQRDASLVVIIIVCVGNILIIAVGSIIFREKKKESHEREKIFPM